MECCVNTLIPFVNAISTTVPYSGNKPTVTVSYLIGGVWQALGVVSQIIFGVASVTVDHGVTGADDVHGATGVIKFVQ
jgi:hypothetical protein